MMRTTVLANRLREVLLSGRWIANTNFKEQLSLVDYTTAMHKVGSLNTIAALTYHVNYYLQGVLEVLKGGELTISDKFSFDVPLLDSSEDWSRLVELFLKNAEEFCTAIEALPDQVLDNYFVDEKYGDYLRNIEGMIEHCYYHLGQVSLVRKLIQENDKH